MPESPTSQGPALVAGVGPPRGLGAAIARRFAREGFRLTVVARPQEQVGATLRELLASGAAPEAAGGHLTAEALGRRMGRPAALPAAALQAALYNADGNWPKSFLDMDAACLERMWRGSAFGCFFSAKAALEALLPRQRGVLLL